MIWLVKFYDLHHINEFNEIINWNDFTYDNICSIESFEILMNDIYRENIKCPNYYNYVQLLHRVLRL